MGLLTDWFCAVWTISLPHFQIEVEDGKRDRWQENGRPSFFEVKRNGAVQFPAAAATRLRHIQELRRPFACRIHGRKRCRDARESHLLRTERGRRQRWQEKVGFEPHVQHVWSALHQVFNYSLYPRGLGAKLV